MGRKAPWKENGKVFEKKIQYEGFFHEEDKGDIGMQRTRKWKKPLFLIFFFLFNL